MSATPKRLTPGCAGSGILDRVIKSDIAHSVPRGKFHLRTLEGIFDRLMSVQ
jgi:hypothetical protein